MFTCACGVIDGDSDVVWREKLAKRPKAGQALSERHEAGVIPATYPELLLERKRQKLAIKTRRLEVPPATVALRHEATEMK
jgi:hypothetical protein